MAQGPGLRDPRLGIKDTTDWFAFVLGRSKRKIQLGVCVRVHVCPRGFCFVLKDVILTRG